MGALSRRGFLAGSFATALVAAACSNEPMPATLNNPAPTPMPTKTPIAHAITVDRVYSAARGREVDLVIVVPERVSTSGLPVCLALHGRWSSARMFLDLGLPGMLTEAVDHDVPPFAVAAVDGADYWVQHGSDDSQAMLRDEVPGWLAQRRLGPVAAAFGISMGGFGALRYARDRDDLKAVAACSPALFTSWTAAKARHVFRDQAHWANNEPLRHINQLRPVPTGVWCGTADPFINATKHFVRQAQPTQSRLTPGAHNPKYWIRVLPEILHFTGTHLE